MSLLTHRVIRSLQIPSTGLTVEEARAIAVQRTDLEPSEGTPETTRDGETNVKDQVDKQ